jgi:hypothetical protein
VGEAACVVAPLAAQVQRRARALARVRLTARPPFPPERCGIVAIRRTGAAGSGAALAPIAAAAGRFRWTLTVDAGIPPHTPQWNGAVALALGRSLLPPGASASPSADALAELGAAEILLPMRPFRSAAARTDLTMDGLRDLAVKFSAPIRLTLRQWLLTGTWRGYAMLWQEEDGVPVLRWRAASSAERFPKTAAIGTTADRLFAPDSRLQATLRTGRPHHGVEAVRTGAAPAWWFTRFGIVRAGGPPEWGGGARAVLALVVLDRAR